MPTTYNPYKDILIALPNTTVALLGAFVFLGLAITQPPQDVYNLLPVSQCHRLLTPELASATILVCLGNFVLLNFPLMNLSLMTRS